LARFINVVNDSRFGGFLKKKMVTFRRNLLETLRKVKTFENIREGKKVF